MKSSIPRRRSVPVGDVAAPSCKLASTSSLVVTNTASGSPSPPDRIDPSTFERKRSPPAPPWTTSLPNAPERTLPASDPTMTSLSIEP
jgi:hypothetical protein